MSFQKQASILVWGVRVGGGGRAGRRNSALLVIKLQVHPIMDFTVPQRHVVLKNRVPLLQYDLVPAGASLGCDQLLKVPDGVIRIALNTHLLLQTVVASNLYHPGSNSLDEADATTSSRCCCAQARVAALFTLFLSYAAVIVIIKYLL